LNLSPTKENGRRNDT